MEYIDIVKDYLHRCRDNLNIIKNNKGNEVTQLLSNCISCLIFIKENIVIDESPITENGLECNIINNSYQINFENNTKEFIRHLRNACCHDKIKIISRNHEIYKIEFRDKTKKEQCKFELTINQIELVYEYLLGLIDTK